GWAARASVLRIGGIAAVVCCGVIGGRGTGPGRAAGLGTGGGLAVPVAVIGRSAPALPSSISISDGAGGTPNTVRFCTGPAPWRDIRPIGWVWIWVTGIGVPSSKLIGGPVSTGGAPGAGGSARGATG